VIANSSCVSLKFIDQPHKALRLFQRIQISRWRFSIKAI